MRRGSTSRGRGSPATRPISPSRASRRRCGPSSPPRPVTTARVEDVAASFQEAVADVLVGKAIDSGEARAGSAAGAGRWRIGELPRSGAGAASGRRGGSRGVPPFEGAVHRQRGDGGAARRAASAGVFSGPSSAYAASRFGRWCVSSIRHESEERSLRLRLGGQGFVRGSPCGEPARLRFTSLRLPPAAASPDPPVLYALTPRRILAALGLSPRKSLGQNFLADRNVAGKIVALARSFPPPFLEIGPGIGALT